MKGWIQIFRTGTHTDSRGRKMKWTERDLDRIATSYDPERREAPIVVGHPKANAPAWGWVAALRRRGQVLEARFRQVAPAFRKAVREGRYKKRSISLYPDRTLRHVGWLGGMPPAIEGMADVKFAGKKTRTYEFSTGGGKMKKGDIEAQLEAQKIEYEEKVEKKTKALKKARRHAAKVEKRLAEYEGEGAERNAKKAAKARRARVGKLIKKGKLAAAQKPAVLAYATALGRTGEKIALGGKKRTVEEHFWRDLEARDTLSVFSHLKLEEVDHEVRDDLGENIAETVLGKETE